MSKTFRVIIVWLCVITLITQSGCVTTHPVLPEEIRAQLGTVAIVPARLKTDKDLDVPAKGWLAGAGRKSARWAGKGAAAPLQGGGGCSGDSSGLCALLVLALSVTAGTIGGLAGGVAGAFQAEPYKKIDAAEDVITAIITSLNMQYALCKEVEKLALHQTSNEVVIVSDQAAASYDEENQYRSFKNKGIDTVLEVAITRIALVGDWDINPPLQFQMDSHIRLVRTTDGMEFYESSIKYKGISLLFNEWADSNAQYFNKQLEDATQYIASWVVRDVFLLNPMPESKESDD